MTSPGPVTQSGATPSIPDKLYFRIGEVARIAGVEPYVLRFWETEFPGLAPKKSGTGQRLYRRKEVEMILEVKRLLYEKRFTIEGARLYLEQNKKKGAAKVAMAAAAPLAQTALFSEPEAAAAPPVESPAAAVPVPAAKVPAGIRDEVLAILRILGG